MELELEDIQALILSGHDHLDHSCFLLLRIREAAPAKTWLGSILGDVVSARVRSPTEAKPQAALHVGFTSQGLKALGIPAPSLATFPFEFQEGLANAQRTRILGDTGDSDPSHWAWGGSPQSEVHAVLMLYACDPPALQEYCAEQRQRLQAAGGVDEVAYEESVAAQQDREPFGFHDGISQPTVEGGAYKKVIGEVPIRAGEFILGYPNEFGTLPFTPTVDPSLDPGGLLNPVTGNATQKDLGRNGSYLVFRKLEQDVPGFEKYFRDQAQSLYGTQDPAVVERLAAKCVGRWKSGAPLVLSPDKDDRALGADPDRNNNFQYAAGDHPDREGFACPIGSHIRRSNPRDSIADTPDISTLVARRHRLIRRGRAYGLPETGQGVAQQGIFFIAINADLGRQFEFIQQTWVNNAKFGGLYEDKDPITGDSNGTSTLTIPERPVRERLNNLPRFVKVLAGGYFFLPGLRTLRVLAHLP